MSTKTLFPILAFLTACLVSPFGCVTQPSDFRQVIRNAQEEVFPTLVYIRVVYKAVETGKNKKGVASGSGVLISPEGELLTNFHVIDKATEIRCLLTDGSAYTATVVGSDKDLDVALLRLVRPKDAPALPYATLSSKGVAIGDVVLAMGAPWGLARSVSMGIISCADRYLDGAGAYTLWYQTDAAISPGNSGGPLVNTAGEVIGLNARGHLMGSQAFTIPSPIIMEVLPNLRKYGNAHWSWFGLQFQPLHDFDRNMIFDATNGVIVAGTEQRSPARKAGIQPNDRVIAIDGDPVTVRDSENLPALVRKLGHMPIGTPARFTVIREGKELEIAITPLEKGEVEGSEKVFERWGFTAKVINQFDTPDLAFFATDGGLFVFATSWDGNASRSGLNERDIILTVDGKPMKTIEELEAVYDACMQKLPEKSQISMTVLRKGRKVQLVLNYREDTEKEIVE
ncbi:MAG: trypsin-like peptidase domain-containing protein [Kiritimatiellae bacterium]|nr:trypsin-like peptidase domain-containing protein [Kiritimatiellia bacterium]